MQFKNISASDYINIDYSIISFLFTLFWIKIQHSLIVLLLCLNLSWKPKYNNALFKLFEYNQLEILLLETSGAYGNNNATKIDFDNHKGMYGLLAMLKEIASTYKFARIEPTVVSLTYEIWGLRRYKW